MSCAKCGDLGVVVVKTPSTVYACGYTTQAEPCPVCFPPPVKPERHDGKLAAAGGDR